ncbi:MAG: alpha/beta hydrolase [Chloroflexota bacterium]
MPFSVDSKIKDLLADEAAFAVLKKHIPALEPKHMNMAKNMTLRAVSKFPQAKEMANKLDAIDADLKKLQSTPAQTTAPQPAPAQSAASVPPVEPKVLPTSAGREELYDRTDPDKWAHPTVASGWGTAGLGDMAEDTLEPGISKEESNRRRENAERMVKEMLNEMPVPEEIVKAGTTTWEDITLTDLEPDAPKLRTMLRTPNGEANTPRPGILFIVGGGLVISDPEIFASAIFELSATHGAVVVIPKYRVAPVWQYPAALNDVHAAFNWMVDNADRLGIDLDRIVILGQSSGGQLTASLTHRLKRVGYPKGVRPRAQVLDVPVIDDREFEPSRRINSGGWPPAYERKTWKAYLGDNYNLPEISPEAVPGHASGNDFAHLPPAFIHCAEHDQDRDDVIRYAQGLLDAGVFCDLHVWGGFSHLSDIVMDAEPVIRRLNLIKAQVADALANDLRRA